MPIFEHFCKKCKKTFERLSKDNSPSPCPGCGKPAKSIISGSGFDLKGKGFYKSGRSSK